MGETFISIVLNGQLILAAPIALAAGIVSFASPCVLPLVPGYLGYIGGMTRQNSARPRTRLLLGVGLFILGFAIIFVTYGALFGAAGSWLVRWQDLVTRLLGVLVVLMGLAFIGEIPFLQRTLKIPTSPTGGLAGAPLLGIIFGLGWTPCLGPTLTAISLLSLDSGSVLRGALLGLIYCAGLGIPFLLIALGLNWMTAAVAFLRRHIRAINIAGGVMLIVIGVLMISGLWTAWIYSLQALIGGFVLPI